MNFTAKQIADILGGVIVGNPNSEVNSVAKIEEGCIGNLCFLANEKYKQYVYTTKASAIIVNNSFKIDKKIKATLIKVDDAYSSFSKLIGVYNKMKFDKVGISEKADICKQTIIGDNVYIGAFTSISQGAKIGNNVKIHSNCYIGENVVIKDDTIIFPNVSIYHDCKIGKSNIVHSGAVIGSDGFGFAPSQDNKYNKISQIGNVETSSFVEIGANTIIDRATMGSTKIREGVKLDNLIQIGHNVTIGKNTVIAALVAIAGSTEIGKNCMIGGQTGIAGHLKIGDNVKIAGQTGVNTNIKNGKVIQGPLAFNQKDFLRAYIIFKRLPEIYKTLQKIEKQFTT
ncbi:MAG: UDP-3-O-(3-hydroxymyristoyl)glucosamine N-acyltransferase [Flavobacteriales bacterium]|nr:UDP-3-O-(3-hydroxymyristoyl)glucosamine N-acyltransferase [Flavobacteriales bacterium]